MKCETGWGLPGIFGFANTLYRSAGCTRRSTARRRSAAWDGHVITWLVANGLFEVANDFSNTDTTTGENFVNNHLTEAECPARRRGLGSLRPGVHHRRRHSGRDGRQRSLEEKFEAACLGHRRLPHRVRRLGGVVGHTTHIKRGQRCGTKIHAAT